MGRITLLKLAALCLISTILPSATALSTVEQAAQAIGLLPRSGACSLAGFAPCNQDGLPENFCCPTTTTCMPFNNKKSAICCPTGETCTTITAISCDITQQNATLHPASELFSTDMSGTLESCNGNMCCPKGYTCQSGQCAIINSSTTASTSSTSSASSSTSSQTTTSSSSILSAPATTSQTSTSSTATVIPSGQANTNGSVLQPHCPQFTAAGTLVGFFSGLASGILLTVIFLCCFGHRRHKDPPSPTSPEFSNVRASISDPIYKSEGMDAVRADFLRRESKPRKSISIRGMFTRSSTMMRRSAPVDGIGRSILNVPQTPVNQRSPSPRMKHEPSMESIKIYSPPGGGLMRPGTQLGDIMHQAGWDPTKPYLGSPGRVDPRSRGA